MILTNIVFVACVKVDVLLEEMSALNTCIILSHCQLSLIEPLSFIELNIIDEKKMPPKNLDLILIDNDTLIILPTSFSN